MNALIELDAPTVGPEDGACDSQPVGSPGGMATFQPLQRVRSNTWPLPRPDNLVERGGANMDLDAGSSCNPEEPVSGSAGDDSVSPSALLVGPVGGILASREIGVSPSCAMKKTSSRRNAWGNLSYADLITQAITSAPDKRLTLSQIYDWMVQHVAYFKDKGDSNSSAGWKNSIRHNLSLHSRFMRVQNEGAGKSSWWMMNPDGRPGKAARRRATSMETQQFERKRGKVRHKLLLLPTGSAPSAAAHSEARLSPTASWSSDTLISRCEGETRCSSDAENIKLCGSIVEAMTLDDQPLLKQSFFDPIYACQTNAMYTTPSPVVPLPSFEPALPTNHIKSVDAVSPKLGLLSVNKEASGCLIVDTKADTTSSVTRPASASSDDDHELSSACCSSPSRFVPLAGVSEPRNVRCASSLPHQLASLCPSEELPSCLAPSMPASSVGERVPLVVNYPDHCNRFAVNEETGRHRCASVGASSAFDNISYRQEDCVRCSRSLQPFSNSANAADQQRQYEPKFRQKDPATTNCGFGNTSIDTPAENQAVLHICNQLLTATPTAVSATTFSNSANSDYAVDLNIDSLDTLQGGLECDVDQVIRHELSVDGSLDFNFAESSTSPGSSASSSANVQLQRRLQSTTSHGAHQWVH